MSNERPVTWYIFGAVVLLAILVAFIDSMSPENIKKRQEEAVHDRECGNKFDAFMMNESFVMKKLLAPDSASFSFSDAEILNHNSKNWALVGEFNAQNAFGATIRYSFMTELEFMGNGDWRCIYTVVGPRITNGDLDQLSKTMHAMYGETKAQTSAADAPSKAAVHTADASSHKSEADMTYEEFQQRENEIAAETQKTKAKEIAEAGENAAARAAKGKSVAQQIKDIQNESHAPKHRESISERHQSLKLHEYVDKTGVMTFTMRPDKYDHNPLYTPVDISDSPTPKLRPAGEGGKAFTVYFHSGLTQPADRVVDKDPYYDIEDGNLVYPVRKDLVKAIVKN